MQRKWLNRLTRIHAISSFAIVQTPIRTREHHRARRQASHVAHNGVLVSRYQEKRHIHTQTHTYIEGERGMEREKYIMDIHIQ
jgi:hypothetical protein